MSNVIAGANYTYTLLVSNAGPDVAQGVVLTDIIPTNTTFVSLTQNAGPAFTLSTPTKGQGGTLTASIPGLAPGTSATFSLVLNVNASLMDQSTIVNSATVTVNPNTTDPNPGNNVSVTTVTSGVAADVAVTLSSFRGAPVIEGSQSFTQGNLIYTLDVANNGPSDAQNATFDFPIDGGPAGVTVTMNAGAVGLNAPINSFLASAPVQNSGPVFTINLVKLHPPIDQTIDINGGIPTLPAGTTSVFTITMEVVYFRKVTATATAGSATFDPSTNNNTSTDLHDVLDAPLVTTSHPDITAIAGKPFTNANVQVLVDNNLDSGLASSQGLIYPDVNGNAGVLGEITSTIDWGDGTPNAVVNSIPESPGLLTEDFLGTVYVLAAHTYAKPGSYIMTVRTTDGPSPWTSIPASFAYAYNAVTVAPPELIVVPTGTLTSARTCQPRLTSVRLPTLAGCCRPRITRL